MSWWHLKTFVVNLSFSWSRQCYCSPSCLLGIKESQWFKSLLYYNLLLQYFFFVISIGNLVLLLATIASCMLQIFYFNQKLNNSRALHVCYLSLRLLKKLCSFGQCGSHPFHCAKKLYSRRHTFSFTSTLHLVPVVMSSGFAVAF